MTRVSIEIPDEPLEKLNKHVSEDKKFVNQSAAIRASIRKTLDMLDEIDRRHQRLDDK